jgi:hypothetical protein
MRMLQESRFSRLSAAEIVKQCTILFLSETVEVTTLSLATTGHYG